MTNNVSHPDPDPDADVSILQGMIEFPWAVMPAGGVDVVAAAGLPVAFGTAHTALIERARLQAGQVLLVLGAGGGVGVAAVQVRPPPPPPPRSTSPPFAPSQRRLWWHVHTSLLPSSVIAQGVSSPTSAAPGRGPGVALRTVAGVRIRSFWCRVRFPLHPSFVAAHGVRHLVCIIPSIDAVWSNETRHLVAKFLSIGRFRSWQVRRG